MLQRFVLCWTRCHSPIFCVVNVVTGTVLYPSLWISGVLNDVFVSGLSGFVGLSVHSQWSLSFQYARALILRLWSVLLVSRMFFR